MLELGTGIAVAGVSISAAAVAITAIKTKGTSGNNGNGVFSQKLCDEKHDSLKGWMKGINDRLDTLLAMHMKEE